MARLEGLLPVFRLAETVRWIAAEEPRLAQAAIAFAAINRTQSVEGGEGDYAGAPGLDTLAGALYGVVSPGESPAIHNAAGFHDGDTGTVPDAAFCRALATVCLALAGDLADPTGGATRFHRHDEMPEWARRREPVALIGAWFFYM